MNLLAENYMKKWKTGIDGLDICIIMRVNKKKNLKDLYLEKISVEDSIKRKNEMSEAGYWDLTINDMIAKIVEIESESESKNSMKINQITTEEKDIKEYESEDKRSFNKHEGSIGKVW